ncbi:MAG: winged helix-turn-helix transcriptional regulator [Candidatus Altiarchaeales archaeon]|nr:winged helix-turn-helix transcriptional regulator [Candidatus Altiarchaeales archaeon]MBD3416087.1 winged helix-turn-helix transcriptional regulator [Candidatus Altiarchaeales archaeon]
MKPKLSVNERKVLAHLIGDGRISCTEIARNLGITSQAVGKIKDKLEKEGFIQGYTAEVDFEKLGVNVFAIAFFNFKSGSWSRLERQDIMQRVKGPHLVRVYRLSEGDITHMVVYGFRSVKEMEHYFQVLQTEREHISELKKVYVISSESILKDSPKELFLKLIDELDLDVLARPEKPKPM